MTYSVKEIFYTLQGEGANAGRPAVFCRFAGCNLWSGREPDRASAVCRFCDTDFVGTDGDFGKKYATAPELAQQITALWPVRDLESRFVVLTGGEPLLQVDDALVDALHACRFWIAVETNGTVVPPDGLDWITVSPKAGAPLNVKRGDEIKLVWPQEGLDPIELEALEFRYRYLQPLDDPSLRKNTQACVELCLRRPQWRLSLQTHKLVGVR